VARCPKFTSPTLATKNTRISSIRRHAGGAIEAASTAFAPEVVAGGRAHYHRRLSRPGRGEFLPITPFAWSWSMVPAWMTDRTFEM
jgi:hypothetical protein